MASFTDNTQALSTFNPYVEQQPIDAMVKVGMQKQQQYNEGYQKIQESIDQVAGLDIGRDVDKSYIQSKLNDTGNRLKGIAGGDFSNFQLQNSTTSMIKNIANDSIIRSAVSSTANDRKQVAQMESDKKEGKLTPHAEYYYGLKRSKYYNNTNLLEEDGSAVAFNGKYDQSWDIDKNMLEAIKAVGESKWSADNVFRMDENKRIMHDSKGQPILSDYAIREKKEGRFSQNVAAAIDGVLQRPEAKQELTMRGIYNYRGYSDINSFIQKYEREKASAIETLEARKIELMEKATEVTTPQEKLAYQSAVSAIEARVISIGEETLAKETEAAQFGSVEGYKAALEIMSVRNNYMKSGVTEQYTSEIMKNVPYEAAQARLQAARDDWAQKDASARGWASNATANYNAETGRMNTNLAQTKWDNDKTNPNNKLKPTTVGDAIPGGTPYQSNVGYFMQSTEDIASDFKKIQGDVVAEYISALNFGNGKTPTPDQVRKQMAAYEKSAPGYMVRMYDRAIKVSSNKALVANPLYSGLLTKIPLAQQAEANLHESDSVNSNMNNDPLVVAAGGKEVNVESISKGYKPFEITLYEEDNATFFPTNRGLFQPRKQLKATVTATDAVNLAIVQRMQGGVIGTARTITRTDSEKKQYERASASLTQKFGVSVDQLMGVTGLGQSSGQLTPANPSLVKAVATVNSQKFANVLAAQEKYLSDNSITPQPLAYTIYNKDAKGAERESTNDRVKLVLNNHKDTGGLDAFNSLYTDEKNFSTQIQIDRGGAFSKKEDFSLNLYNAAGLVKSIPISSMEANYLKGSIIDVPAGPSATARRLQASGVAGTTNAGKLKPNHPDAYKGAMIPGSMFQEKFNSTNVLGAEVVKLDGGGHGVYLYVKTNAGVIGVPAKANKGDITPNRFTSADDATKWITSDINNKAMLDNLINNGL